MNLRTERFTITGPAGALEVARDQPEAPSRPDAPRGTVIITHPHPLFGGTLDNKVVQTLARAHVAAGWLALRFNFRGVGASAGTHDEGHGECEDLLALAEQLAPSGAGPLALAGFSFGAFVATHAAARLWAQRGDAALGPLVLVGTAASRFAPATLPEPLRGRTLTLHGEHDDTVPLASVLDWARPQLLPVTVVPGGGHFFHGQLPLLKSLVVRHLKAGHP